MRSIGELARASGLTVSALRFYDGAGVLVPAQVDAVTGYRRYTDDQVRAARLIAGLRRVGMPVTEIARAVQNPDFVREILALHLQKLENGLADAKRELSRIHALLDLEERLMTRVTLSAAALTAACASVRFAAAPTSTDIPVLAGVLVETDGDALLVMATDRYRLACSRVPAEVDGPPARLVLPMDFVTAVGERYTVDEPVTCELTEKQVRVGELETVPLAGDYPDLQRAIAAIGTDRQTVPVDVAALREAVATSPGVWREHEGLAYEIAVLGVDPVGGLRVAAESEWAGDTAAHVAVNREFLLQALDAGGAGQLVLELDGPIKPLVLRGSGEQYSLLMPVRH